MVAEPEDYVKKSQDSNPGMRYGSAVEQGQENSGAGYNVHNSDYVSQIQDNNDPNEMYYSTVFEPEARKLLTSVNSLKKYYAQWIQQEITKNWLSLDSKEQDLIKDPNNHPSIVNTVAQWVLVSIGILLVSSIVIFTSSWGLVGAVVLAVAAGIGALRYGKNKKIAEMEANKQFLLGSFKDVSEIAPKGKLGEDFEQVLEPIPFYVSYENLLVDLFGTEYARDYQMVVEVLAGARDTAAHALPLVPIIRPKYAISSDLTVNFSELNGM